MHYFFKKIFFSTLPGIEYKVMMNKEGSTKIVNFKKNVLFSSLSILFPLIAIVLLDYDAAILYNCWFYLLS